ncbi:hypothetical protein AB1I62_08860 [Enterococcus sp. AN402]|uniref:hypothetical protein n=1 Tax=Enterococcus sp. AN402 TaxID=3151386 RepID=UPI003459E4B8
MVVSSFSQQRDRYTDNWPNNNAFNQAVKIDHIIPFYKTEGKGPAKVKLYLREELEEYTNRKRAIIKRTTHFIKSKPFFCNIL